MKHSIKERAKKVPAKIKLKVWVHCLWIDIKYYLNKICESDLEADITLKHLSNKFCTADKYILIPPSKHDFTMTDKIEEPIEDYPVYDEKYLNECIKKAALALSKIKDVDKALDEIRGIEQEFMGAEEWMKDNYFDSEESKWMKFDDYVSMEEYAEYCYQIKSKNKGEENER